MAQNNENREIAIQLSGVKKMYRLGQIGGGTLQADLQSWWARKRGKEDPNTKIGQEKRLVGQTFMALNGIDLTVYRGEALGIIGGNGAGKSTMLKLLSQVTAPTAGTIDLYGRVASMLEVGTGFNGEMTGRENIYMNGAILGMTKAEIDAKMEDIIEFSEVRDFIDTPVKRYSSGMYVKLAFSVAAHLDSEIMIMDEVLAVGDMAFQNKCLNKMRNVAKNEGRTVLYVSHNMNTIRQLCDRCIVLNKGKIIFEGDVDEAIQLYIGTVAKPQKEYIFEKKNHPKWVPESQYFIKKVILDKDKELVYDEEENVNFTLECESGTEWDEVSFRFEIKNRDQAATGTALSENKVPIYKGNNIIKVVFDTNHLKHGQYFVDIVAFQTDEFGNEVLIDAVYPGFILDVTSNRTKTSIVWLEKWWGYIQLHDAKIENIT